MINLIAMLMILAVFSIFFGFITKDMFIGLGSGFFSDNALFIHPSHEIMLDTEFGVPTLFKLLPLIFTISLSVIAIVLSEYLSTILIYFKLSRVGYNIFSFFNQRFLIELFYNRYVTGIVLKLGGQTTKVIDKGSVEYLGPYGLEKGLLNISNNIARLNTGVITSYALYILIGLIFYLLFNSYMNNSIIILSLFISSSLVLYKNTISSNIYKSNSITLLLANYKGLLLSISIVFMFSNLFYLSLVFYFLFLFTIFHTDILRYIYNGNINYLVKCI
jgi:NADH-ubiquinone oxidoreductase chain 5